MGKIIFERNSKPEKILKNISYFQIVLFAIVLIAILIDLAGTIPVSTMVLFPICFVLFAVSIVVEIIVIIYFYIKQKSH